MIFLQQNLCAKFFIEIMDIRCIGIYSSDICWMRIFSPSLGEPFDANAASIGWSSRVPHSERQLRFIFVHPTWICTDVFCSKSSQMSPKYVLEWDLQSIQVCLGIITLLLGHNVTTLQGKLVRRWKESSC